MENVYVKGTIKVVWIEGGDKIYSKMFEDLRSAREFSEEKIDFLIFKLKKQKGMKEFTWELLPYGKAEIYNKLLSIYKKGVLSKLINKFEQL